MSKLNDKKAFTLAEALIALTLIGVVAAMTIPGLKKYSQSTEYAAQLKKAYLSMEEAIDSATIDNGPISTGTTVKWSGDLFLNYMVPQWNVIKKCTGNTAVKASCMSNSTDSSGTAITITNAVILADGTAIGAASGAVTTAAAGRTFYVDINNKELPNKEGFDLFIFIFQGKLVDGEYNWNFMPSGTKTQTVVNNGWKIKW